MEIIDIIEKINLKMGLEISIEVNQKGEWEYGLHDIREIAWQTRSNLTKEELVNDITAFLKELDEIPNDDLLKEFKENPRKFPVDHINNDSLRNTRANLRIVSNRQNCQNKKYKGKSRFPGVSWDKYMKQWAARIRIKNKRIHLGYFKDEREAAKAYEKANRKYNKEEIVCKIVRGKNYA